MLETVIEQFGQTTSIEWFAFSFAILQVIFAYLNKPINFLFGAISVCFYIFLFFQADLIAESILNVYYLVVSILGLILWNRKKSEESHIGKANKRNWQVTAAITISCFIAMLIIYLFREKSLDISMTRSHYIDALVTAFAFGGTYLLLKRKLETWIILNISNLIAIPLQWSKGLYLTALLTAILFAMAVAGYYRWRKVLHS